MARDRIARFKVTIILSTEFCDTCHNYWNKISGFLQILMIWGSVIICKGTKSTNRLIPFTQNHYIWFIITPTLRLWHHLSERRYFVGGLNHFLPITGSGLTCWFDNRPIYAWLTFYDRYMKKETILIWKYMILVFQKIK